MGMRKESRCGRRSPMHCVGPTIIVFPVQILVRQVTTSMYFNPCEGTLTQIRWLSKRCIYARTQPQLCVYKPTWELTTCLLSEPPTYSQLTSYPWSFNHSSGIPQPVHCVLFCPFRWSTGRIWWQLIGCNYIIGLWQGRWLSVSLRPAGGSTCLRAGFGTAATNTGITTHIAFAAMWVDAASRVFRVLYSIDM